MNCDNCGNDVFEGHYTILCHKPDCIKEAPRQSSADELTKFENWAKGKNLPTMPNGDVYVHVESQMAWEAWQARAELREVSQHPEPAKGGTNG